jgi:molybdopterin-containing oxidoreductase family iron-sulfur binding subunit
LKLSLDLRRQPKGACSQLWSSLDQRLGSPAWRKAVEAEFAEPFADPDRRQLFKLMGASMALAGLTGCGLGPDPDALPYVQPPDHAVLGSPRYYASAVLFGGYAQPVLGKTYEGRPIKLEGLPEHPVTQGATDAFTQAALLNLYDPDRTRAPLFMGQTTSWAAFDTAMVQKAAALNARQGEGFHLLTGPVSSPTTLRQLHALTERWPRARWYVFDPLDCPARRAASAAAFGRTLDLHPRLDQCATVVSLDDDLLGPGPRQTPNARAWSRRRKAYQASGQPCRLMVAEPAPTLTGAMAEDRLIASAADIERLTLALAVAVGAASGPEPGLTPRQAQWVQACATQLGQARGQTLVAIGPWYSAQTQALALSINAAIGAVGPTLALTEPILAGFDDPQRSIDALAEALRSGGVDTLAFLDADPVYAAPADFGFARLMDKVPLRIHVGLHADETAALCHWHLPVEHELETWADARAVDGRPSLIQPLVRPFYDVRPRSVLIENLQGRMQANGRDLFAETWKERLGEFGSNGWREALTRGFLDDPAPEVTAKAAPAAALTLSAPTSDLTALIRPDPTVWDGAGADNPWLQELPKPFNKVTWENIVAVSPALAAERRLTNGDVVRLDAGQTHVQGPVWITPGLERRSVVLTLGYGRNIPGQKADRLGYDAYPLRTAASPWRLDGVRLTPTGGRRDLASTQPYTALDGYDFVRTMDRSSTGPGAPHAPPPSFYPARPMTSPHWGMAIDTDLCIGCNACITACDAENNIPMVGQDQVARGRQMHWLRVDLYFEGEPDEPKFYNQPVPCMHCEQAPCEMGCPVNAAVHSSDGLNLQVYNRCIGTRTCSSFCPYKVRRFNWYDFTSGDPPEVKAARNPEVTVRARGVMEKCTYCVQRIEKARIQAKVENRPIAEGEVRTACQQACPTEAIVFGDVTDPNSRVSRLKAQARNYSLLEEVNTRPNTTYLAKLKDEGGG